MNKKTKQKELKAMKKRIKRLAYLLMSEYEYEIKNWETLGKNSINPR